LYIHQRGDGRLEQHEHHHDAEDLQGITRHVHADGVHGQLFRGCDGELPGFLQLERVYFGGRGRFAGLGRG
jgi:hypothetical protein